MEIRESARKRTPFSGFSSVQPLLSVFPLFIKISFPLKTTRLAGIFLFFYRRGGFQMAMGPPPPDTNPRGSGRGRRFFSSETPGIPAVFELFFSVPLTFEGGMSIIEALFSNVLASRLGLM